MSIESSRASRRFTTCSINLKTMPRGWQRRIEVVRYLNHGISLFGRRLKGSGKACFGIRKSLERAARTADRGPPRQARAGAGTDVFRAQNIHGFHGFPLVVVDLPRISFLSKKRSRIETMEVEKYLYRYSIRTVRRFDVCRLGRY